jgi:hypothetical protein
MEDLTFGWGSIELIGTGASELIQVGQSTTSFDSHAGTSVRFSAPHQLGNFDQGSDAGIDFETHSTVLPLIVVDGAGGNDTITAWAPRSPNSRARNITGCGSGAATAMTSCRPASRART